MSIEEVHVTEISHTCTKEGILGRIEADVHNLIGWAKSIEKSASKTDDKVEKMSENMMSQLTHTNGKVDNIYKLMSAQLYVIVGGVILTLIRLWINPQILKNFLASLG